MKKSDSHYQTDLFSNVVKKVHFYKEKKKGMKEGLKANRINTLNRQLLSSGLKEDIIKALVNSEYQAALLREYEL